MRTRIVLIFCTALVVLTGSSCGGDEERGKQVVAAFYPLAYAAERVAPGESVRNLTPAGAEPHDLELSARDVAELDAAKLVLYLGRGFMPALEDAVADAEHAVDLLEGEALLDGTSGGEAVDPHVWLSPKRFARIARRIATALGTTAAADELVGELDTLDREYRAGLASCDRRELVTSHAAFGYLAAAYGLEQLALAGLGPEAEPGPRALEALVEDVERSGATTVFFEPLVSPALARTVAREAGVATAELDPLEGLAEEELERGADYFSVMRENLAALRRALGCR